MSKANPNNQNRLLIITTIAILLCLTSEQSCLADYQFYDYVANLCMPCSYNCLNCIDASICTTCIKQFYLQPNNSTCLSCPFGCSICTNSTSCTTCQQGLYINSQGVCLSCSTGVKSCTIALVQSCKDGYFILGSICLGCMQHCTQCEDFITCKLCDSGYYVQASSNMCQACSPNCDVCQDVSFCTSCNQGYILSGGSCSLPNCSSISPFCQKCTNPGVCQQCSFGKYVDTATGKCVQGASLLCLTASGPYHTNCQTNLYGCPSYATIKIDSQSGNQLPICLPLHASQDKQYKYQSYTTTSCPINSSSTCPSAYNKTFTFQTLKPFYKLMYHISLKLYSGANHQIVINFLDSTSAAVFNIHNINITNQYNDNLSDSLCYNCRYSYTIIQGQVSYSGSTQSAIQLQIQSPNSLFIVSQILIQTNICKVSQCAQCTTPIDCISCSTPYYLQLIQCVLQCDPGFYTYGRTCVLACPSQAYPIQSSYQCSKCVSPCLTCTSELDCSSCMSGFYLDGSRCVTHCSSPTMFTNLTSGSCQNCPNPCNECNITILNSSAVPVTFSIQCSTCTIGYLLQGGSCTYICPSGTFSNYINNKTQCSSCHTGCTSCAISQYICQSCSSSYLLDNSTCNINYSCPSGYYIDNSINSCNKCHYPCMTCSATATNCTSCYKGVLYNNTCPIVCPSHMYIQYTTNTTTGINQQVCQTCISPCVQCITALLCVSCINGTYLYDKQCVSACPTDYYYQSNVNNTCIKCVPPCLQCMDATRCLSCTTGYVDLSTHTCTLQCNSTSYVDTNFVCQPCVAPCLGCYSTTKCYKCQLPYVLDNQTCITEQTCQNSNKYVKYNKNYSDVALPIIDSICQSCMYPCLACNKSAVVCTICVNNYILVPDLSTCVQTCPQTYYQTTLNSTSVCSKCDANCLQCVNTSILCTQCGTGMYLYSINSTCVLSCPSTYYSSNQQSLCKQCQSPCIQCYNIYLCKSCISPLIYYSKACVSVCPQGSIHNTTTNICQPCTNNCLSCSIMPSNCTQCPTNGFYFYQYQCVVQCPSLYYADDISHNCQPCAPPCLSCTSSLQCTSCVSMYYYYNVSNQCLTICPQSYYTDTNTNTCLPCNSTVCRTCAYNSNNCTQCAYGYYYDYNSTNVCKCVQVCPISTYADTLYQQCRACRYPCLQCVSQDTCNRCGYNYKLYTSNCYSSCPIGYYQNSTNSSNISCLPCNSICQICTSLTVCKKCISGYYVNASSICVQQCQPSYYKAYDTLTNYPICILCPSACAQCVQSYNCTICKSGYYLFNGLCVDQCPSMYYAQLVTVSVSQVYNTCMVCPKYCNKCTSALVCLQCLNSYIYNSTCYLQCPATTYVYNQQKCLDCSSPCRECTAKFTCTTCIANYFYFQNYCVQKCPDDVWKYPQTMSCSAYCPYIKYVQKMQCYVNGCGGMLVQMGGICLDMCPDGYYVDHRQNCISCGVQPSMCKKLFIGQLTILRSYNMKAVIYFNYLINYQNINTNKIQAKFYDKNDNTILVNYAATNIYIDQSMLMIQFGYREMQLYVLQVKIPYIIDKDNKQSIQNNFFKANIYFYNDYNYGATSNGMTMTQSTYTNNGNNGYNKVGSSSSFANTPSQPNTTYQPSQILSILAIALPCCTFVLLIINIIVKGTHYRQLLDFFQFIAATLYLQLQYPPVMEQYLKSLKISLFTFLPRVANFQPYAFSPSKYIQYHTDSSLMRTQGLLFIVFLITLISFLTVVLVNKYCQQPPHFIRRALLRIKYKNITDLYSIVALPLLIFSFKFTITSHLIDVMLSIFTILSIVLFVIFMSYILMTAQNLKQIQGLAGQVQKTQSKLGHLYTPFAFIRKIIFGLVLCIQPDKPISTLTLLLIFTILIMVCLYFYQPFQNQITDYICIFMEIILIVYVIVVILFGLNIVDGNAGHNMGIAAVAISLIGGGVGLGWLAYLTYAQVIQFKNQNQETVYANGLLNQNSGQNINKSNQNESKFGTTLLKIGSQQKNSSQSDRNSQKSKAAVNQDEPSASQLIRGSKLNSQNSDLESNQSRNNQQFRHWNNSQSDKNSEIENNDNKKAPKYLQKIDRKQQRGNIQQRLS